MAWRVFKKDPKRSKWTIEGRDHLNVKWRMPAFRDKALSEELARNVAKIVEHRRQDAPLPPLLAGWVQMLAPDIKERLARFGVLDAQAQPLAKHLDDYAAALRDRDNCEQYVKTTISRLQTIVGGIGARYWSDVKPSAVQRLVASVRRGKAIVGKRTQNGYLSDFKSFARWCIDDGRLASSPVACLKPLDAAKVRNDCRRLRRPYEVEEVRRLLEAARRGRDHQGRTWAMSGSERAMAYRLAVETGLRQNELRSLTRPSFELDGEEPAVTVAGQATKNRHLALVPLRPEMVADLRPFLATRLPSAPVFNMPNKDRMIELLRADLGAARQAWLEEDAANGSNGDFLAYCDCAGRYADFHALRHTTGSWLAAAGVHPKLIQRVMRHSTITLTLDRYTHAFKADEAAAIQQLPSLSNPPVAHAAATGTDDHAPPLRGAIRGAKPVEPWHEQSIRADSTLSSDGRAQGAAEPQVPENKVLTGDQAMRARGLEPPRVLPHQNLNLARLGEDLGEIVRKCLSLAML